MSTRDIGRRRSALPTLLALATVAGLAACNDSSSSPLGLESATGMQIGEFSSPQMSLNGFTADLIAGQNMDVGDVSISDDGTDLTVHVVTVEPWCITELHIDAGDTENDIPQTKNGNPIPGQFEINEELDCAIDVTRTLALPPLGEDGKVAVAVHAVVSKSDRVLLATQNNHPSSGATEMEARIYGISPIWGTETLIDDQLEAVLATTDNFNGNAYDAENGWFYFSRFDRISASEPLPSPLFFNDLEGTQTFAGDLAEGAAGGAFHQGVFYYVAERTAELRQVTFFADGTVDTESVVNANVLAGTKYNGSVLGFGDLTVSPDGRLYYAATVITGGFPGVLMRSALDGTGSTLIVDGSGTLGAGGIQIAFGGDGHLYGVNARAPFGLFEIDPATGVTTTLFQLDRSYSDLASGQFPFMDETAWCYGTEFPFEGRGQAGGNWGLYCEYTPATACEQADTFYGTDLGTGATGDRIFRIHPTDLEAEFVFNTDLSDGELNYPNGNAFDEVGNRLFYADGGDLYIYDFVAGTQAGPLGDLTGGPELASGTWFDGEYLYVPQGTDDLWSATYDGSFAKGLVLANFTGAANLSLGFGDLIVVNGTTIYGSTNTPDRFWSMNTDGTGWTLVCTGDPDPGNAGDCPGHLQLAIGSGGEVFGHHAGTGMFYEIDLATATTSEIGTIVEEGGQNILKFTDFASGPQECVIED